MSKVNTVAAGVTGPPAGVTEPTAGVTGPPAGVTAPTAGVTGPTAGPTAGVTGTLLYNSAITPEPAGTHKISIYRMMYDQGKINGYIQVDGGDYYYVETNKIPEKAKFGVKGFELLDKTGGAITLRNRMTSGARKTVRNQFSKMLDKLMM